jgi:group II intron reverse transcriptase/maturase
MSSEMLSAEKYLSIINDRGKRRLPLERVYHNLRKRDLFLQAYHHLYSNAGALTKGIDPSDTVEAMSLKRIETILKQLEEGRYTWKPTRRVEVPKPNGGRRPISMPGWNDKLVQEVIRMILEAYYEPRFRDSSHGFRPNRGCHTALQQIKRSWTGTKWFIEVDIKGCFDNLDHQLILDILRRDIHDDRFVKLVTGMLEAGYMEAWRYYETHSGAPQGGVASPILANIAGRLFGRKGTMASMTS